MILKQIYYLLAIVNVLLSSNCYALFPDAFPQESSLTVSGHVDASFRETNYDTTNHETSLFNGDSRIEYWAYPGKKVLSWGPYVRFSGIISDHQEAWENAWLALPGYGIQVYPFSWESIDDDNGLKALLGPLRAFAEYNKMDYWGRENSWRPKEQTRFGIEYWKQSGVNKLDKPFWYEIWNGLIWQSANEFDKDYDTLSLGNALRLGVREPDCDLLSIISPYAYIESSLTENGEYYWDNRLILGGGIRITPTLENWLSPGGDLINRLVFYAEYGSIACYYHDDAPGNKPNNDFRFGISLSIGEWWDR